MRNDWRCRVARGGRREVDRGARGGGPRDREARLTEDGGRSAILTRRLSQHQYRAVLHRQITA